MKKRVIVAIAALLLGLGLSHDADAGAATDVVKAKQTALFEALKQPKSAASDKKVAGLFDEMLDYQALAEGSLGAEWAARSPQEREEFTQVLKDLVRKAYEKNLRKTLAFEIKYENEEAAGNGTLVNTRAVHKTDARQEAVEIDFKLVESGGKWKVVDIVTEGVSLVQSYRSQFTKIIKKDGFPVLIKKMKDKLAKGDV